VISDAALLFIAIIALLLFGNKLPAMMRKLGVSLSEFKRAMETTREDVRRSAERSEEKASQDPLAGGQEPGAAPPIEPPATQLHDGGT
jgi:TatA/E family protein of Tat protein translocase